MKTTTHEYNVAVSWAGNSGTGTSAYNAYGREHTVTSAGPPMILASADPAFRGDPSRWNPEQLLVAALSQCHMLWYLNLAAEADVTVIAYEDNAHGVMSQDDTGAGQFDSVTLRPHVTISAGSDPQLAEHLHSKVPDVCFIARSVNFPVHHEPVISVVEAG